MTIQNLSINWNIFYYLDRDTKPELWNEILIKKEEQEKFDEEYEELQNIGHNIVIESFIILQLTLEDFTLAANIYPFS